MNEPFESELYAERNRNEAYDAVIRAIHKVAEEQGINRKEIAEKIGRKPAQVSAWLSGPSNWTLDTISNLLYAVDATMDYKVVFNRDRSPSNEFHPLEPVAIWSRASDPQTASTGNHAQLRASTL